MSSAASGAGVQDKPLRELMEYRNLGPTGLRVSRMGFGSWVTVGSQIDVDKTYKLMKQAYDAGINFLDSAETYGDGAAETVLGKAMAYGEKKNDWTRQDWIVTTKIFFGDKKPAYPAANARGLSRKHIVEGMRNSLKRFDMSYVDIVFCHRPDPLCPIEETVRSMNHLIDLGLAFYWGTSEWNVHDLTEAFRVADRLGLVGPVVEQPQYNIFHRMNVEQHYMPLYKNPGIGLTVWSPLASGILTGKYSGGKIPEGSRFSLQGYEFLKESKLHWQDWQVKCADELKPIADQLGCSRAQLALAWVLANPNVTCVLLGASKPEQLEDNLNALRVVPMMSKEIMNRIDEIAKTKPEEDDVYAHAIKMRTFNSSTPVKAA